jgi:hypothetical protein
MFFSSDDFAVALKALFKKYDINVPDNKSDNWFATFENARVDRLQLLRILEHSNEIIDLLKEHKLNSVEQIEKNDFFGMIYMNFSMSSQIHLTICLKSNG